MAIYPFQPGTSDNSDPTILRTPWDIVQLGEFTLPGISTVEISRSRNYQIKKPKDQSYAQIKDTGLDLAKVTITNTIGGVSSYIPGESNNSPLLINYQAQVDILETILKFFDTQLGIKAKTKSTVGDKEEVSGFAVNHPALQMRGINSLYITEIDGPKVSKPGFMVTTFKCIETKSIKHSTTKSVKVGTTFAQGSAFTKNPQPAAPSTNPAATGPKK